MEAGFDAYGHADEFPPEFFLVHISRTEEGTFMGDQSTYHLSFEFPREKFSSSLGFYDFFLGDDLKTEHYQPVF